MAEVFVHEDDHLSPYPKAPPPSPELQQRTFNDIFEGLTLSKFETPCGFERHSTDWYDTTQVTCSSTVAPAVYPLNGFHGNSSAEGYSLQPPVSSTHLSHSQDSASGSNFLEFPSSCSHSNTPSPPSSSLPPLSELELHHHSSPRHVERRRLSNGFSPNHYLPPTRHSQSFSEVAARVSELASGEDLRPRGLSLNSSFEEDSSNRRRKISLKRKNDELDGLQFSFEYSYSSSSGDSENWVVIDPSSYPTGKKACQDSPVTRQRASSFGGVFVGQQGVGAGVGRDVNSVVPTSVNCAADLQVQATALHPQRNSAPDIVSHSEPLAEQRPQAPHSGPLNSLTSIDSEMDCGEGVSLAALGRLDSLDSMDTGGPSEPTGALGASPQMTSDPCGPQMTSDLCGHGGTPQNSLRFSPVPRIITSGPGRSFSSGWPHSDSEPSDPLAGSKFNTMEQFFSSYHGENSFLSSTTAVDSSNFNFLFSKSL